MAPSKSLTRHITCQHLILFSLPSLAGHPSEIHKHDTMQQHFYWPHVANGVYITVHESWSCPQNGSQVTPKRKLNLFQAAGPFVFVAIGILGPLPETTNGSQHFIIITYRFSKSTRAMPTAKINSTQIVITFLKNWII